MNTNVGIVTLNVVVGTLVIAIAIASTWFVVFLKKRRKINLWFAPIGLKMPAVGSNLQIYICSQRKKWKNPTFTFFMGISIVFMLAWFGGYFVVNVIFLSEWNEFVSNYAVKNYRFFWDDDLCLSNGRMGGYRLSNGEHYLLPFLMRQFNVTMYLTKMLNYKIYLLDPTKYCFDSDVSQNAINLIKDSLSTNGNNRVQLTQDIFLWLHSFTYSNVFLTPLCQFLSICFPLSILFSQKRDYASFFAPLAALGGTVTVLGGIAFDPDQVVSWQFIFYDQQMFFLYHFFLLVVGCMWMGINNRYSLSRLAIFAGVGLGYVFYVLFVAKLLHIEYFTTGLTAFDLQPGGSYEIANDWLPDAFPYSAVIMIGGVFLIPMFIAIGIKNIFHSLYWKKILGNNSQSFKNDLVVFLRGIQLKFSRDNF